MAFSMAQERQVSGAIHQTQCTGHLIVGKAVQCQVRLETLNT